VETTLKERLSAARKRKRPEPDDERDRCNLLVVSDNHLGEYIKEHARIDYLKRSAEIDRDFCNFLEYYAANRHSDVPWRLIINGDFVDFLTVTVMPSESAQESAPNLQLDEEERLYGLDSDEDKVVWKLHRILERHSMAFTYLADFVGKGNYLDLLPGNHDAEFFWPIAKEAFVDALVEIFFGTEDVVGQSETAFRSRISWHEWFLHLPGRLFIEHGNQYDDFSSFEYRLCPVLPFRAGDLTMPASHMAIHYFVNHMDGFRTHNKDNWTLIDFLRWMLEQGAGQIRFVLRSYVQLARRVIRYSKQIQKAEQFEVKSTHEKRLAEEAQRYDLDLEVAKKIDALRNSPIHGTTAGAYLTTSVDIWGYLLAYCVALVVVLALPGWLAKGVGLGIWVGAVIWREHVFSGLRKLLFGRAVTAVVAPKLTEAAGGLGKLLDVRYIVMGHTHKPMVKKVRNDPPCWYINSGSWLAPEEKERHHGGCRSPLTYATMTFDSAGEHQLWRWCQRDNQPEKYNARLGSEAEPAERTRYNPGRATAELEAQPTPKRSTKKTKTDTNTRPSLRKRRY